MPLGIARLNTLGRIISAAAPPASTRTPKTITAYGNAQVSTAQSKFGGSSALFDGSGDYLDVGLDGTLRFLQNNFTIELWYRPTGRTSNYPLLMGNNGVFGTGSWVLHERHDSANTKFTFWVENYNGGAPMFTSTTSVSNDTWYHIAIVRNSNTWKMYINGVEEGTVSYSGNLDSGSPAYNPTIGGSSNGNNYVQGFIDEVRWSNTARYTTNFTPSTSAFTNDANTVLLIHANDYNGSTTFVDDGGQTLLSRTPAILTANGNIKVSTAQSKFGGASILGDGTGDFISTPFRLDYDIARTSTWTVECWLRPSTVTGITGIANCQVYGDSKGWTLYTNGTNVQFLDAASGYTNLITSGVTLAVDTWYHIALVRNGSNLNIYIDGVSRASTTGYTSKNATTGPLRIGEGSAISSGLYLDPYSEFRTLNGYMDEFRISNTARYTTNFTPSTTPFTNDDNTVILVHGDGYTGYTTFVDDGGQTIQTPSRAPVTLTAISGAKMSTAQSKIGTSSMLLTAASSDVVRATNVTVSTTFTYDLWVRFNSLPGSFQMFIGSEGSSNETYFGLYNNSGTYQYTSVIQGVDRRFTPSALATNTWIHLALIKDGATWKLYENGVETTVASTSGSVPTNYGMFHTTMRIGSYYNNSLHFNGYMDEIRYSNSVRYTTNFTPSTTAFTNDANTLMLIHADDYNLSTDFVDDNGVNPVFSADSYSTYLKLAVPFDKYYGVRDVAYIIKGSGSTSARTQGSSSTMSSADSYWNTYPYYEKSLLNSRDDNALSYTIDGNIPSSASGTFVVEGWFKPTDNGTNQNWVLSSADNNGRWLFGFNTGASISFGGENNIGFGSSTWQHVAIVCDAGTKRFYLNGVYKGAWVSSNSSFSPLHVGQFQGGDPNDYRGYIQDLRVYVGTNKGYTGTNASAANFTLPTSIIASY